MRLLKKVVIEGCDESSQLVIELVKCVTTQIEEQCCKDGIWRIQTPGSPHRLVRLFNGNTSIVELLNRYSFNDVNGCSYTENGSDVILHNLAVNARKVGISIPRAERGLKSRFSKRFYCTELPVLINESEARILKTVGMPQRTAQSGICWFGSLIWALVRPSQGFATFCHHVKDKSLVAAFKDSLNGLDKAETLRRRIFDEMRLGDDPVNTLPQDEGQNGFTVFTCMCSRLGVPVTTLVYNKGELHPFAHDFPDADEVPVPAPRAAKPHEPALLGIRVHRSHWKPKKVMQHANLTYYLQGAMIGSELCGHQCSLARSANDTYHFYDSDGVRLGIGPICFQAGEEDFWNCLQYVLPYSNNTDTSKFCDFSPHNRSPLKVLADNLHAENAAEVLEGVDTDAPAHRLVNVDWLYATGTMD